MKMKNIAFFGVMASILSVAGAYAEDSSTPTTIIATKSYVDTKDATKADASTVSTHINNGDIHVTAAQKTSWTGKQDAISDLSTIRSGAGAGATAVQTVKKNGTAVTKTDGVVDISVPTKTSEITNDSGFITSASLPTSSNFVTNGTNALSLTADTTKAPSVTAVQGIVTTNQRTATTGTDAAVDTLVPTEKAVATALAGKQNTLSTSNKLNTSYINTGSSARFVTDTEKSTWSGKVGSVVEGTTNGTIKVDGTAVSVHGLGSAAYTESSAYDAAGAAATAKSEAIAGAAGGAYDASGTYSNNTIGKALQGKQDTISDLATIRSGAAAGATALQSGSALNGANLTAGTVAKTALASGVQTSLGKADTALQSAGITASGTTNKIVQYGANGLITSGTTAGALATKSTIANADVASNAAIAYSKMAAPTATINGGTAACSASAPCVLSYDGSSYSWTTFAY